MFHSGIVKMCIHPFFYLILCRYSLCTLIITYQCYRGNMLLKKTGICLDSTFCKIYTMSFFLKCYSRFIESNMIISSNSKKLQINPTYHGNYLVIFFTGVLTVCIHSVWNICMGFFNIYMVQ